MDTIAWLQRWYATNCDGTWEQDKGARITTLDNPGWLVTIDLAGTPLAGASDRVIAVQGDPPSARNGNVGGRTWMECQIVHAQFRGAGDAGQLAAILDQFRTWATSSPSAR